MVAYDIYIAFVSWAGGGKSRPVLILREGIDRIEMLGITTRFYGKSENDRSLHLRINDWRQAGLLQESYINATKVISLPRSAMERMVGALTESDVRRLEEFLAERFLCDGYDI